MIMRTFRIATLAVAALTLAAGVACAFWLDEPPVPPSIADRGAPAASLPAPSRMTSFVVVEKTGENSFRYLVNGRPQVFVGMGYNPIYRYLPDDQRAANYDRDFRLLCEAGVNHIIGWDRDKGYDQDKFDELTLDYADKYGIGVLMPFVLPALRDYNDPALRDGLLEAAAAKVRRFKDHPALRIWGVGNEVMLDGLPPEMMPTFGRFYLELADMIHEIDPNHPVIYRESEDFMVPAIVRFLQRRPPERPWLLYGMNVYSMELERMLDEWPYYGFDRPLIVTEFGSYGDGPDGRAGGYLDMWRLIRAHPDYALGGAPYVWTTEGPEPTDEIWGLMDVNSRPIDDTFDQLRDDWLTENGGPRSCG